MSLLHEHTARLTTGRMSYEKDLRNNVVPPRVSRYQPEAEVDPEWGLPLDTETEEWVRQQVESYPSPARAEDGRGLDHPVDPDDEDTNRVVSRPAWLSFVTCLQLHFPEVGEEIAPALQIGKVPPTRVVLSQDALDFLNRAVGQWYQQDVEIYTIECSSEVVRTLPPTVDLLYKRPFRPVTGLRVIVTPTFQRSMVPRDARVLRAKERWGRLEPLEVIRESLSLLVEGRVPKDHRKGPSVQLPTVPKRRHSLRGLFSRTG